MKEKPILFSGPMVRAILDGTKTQTRRVVKPQPESVHDGEPYWHIGGYRAWQFRDVYDVLRMGGGNPLHCPYGDPGDRLWGRESWAKALYGCGVELLERWEPGKEGPYGVGAIYAATPHPAYKGSLPPSL